MIDFKVNTVSEVVDFLINLSADQIIDKFTKNERSQKLLIYGANIWKIKCV